MAEYVRRALNDGASLFEALRTVQARCTALKEENRRLLASSLATERDYILPAFEWAKEVGLDLPAEVRANPGRNCVEILVRHLIDRGRDANHDGG